MKTKKSKDPKSVRMLLTFKFARNLFMIFILKSDCALTRVVEIGGYDEYERFVPSEYHPARLTHDTSQMHYHD